KKKLKTNSSKAKGKGNTKDNTKGKGKNKGKGKEKGKGKAASLGSEDAYVLMYVRKDYLLEHARLVSSRDPSTLPSESSRAIVTGENVELRRGDDRVREKSDNLRKMIARRKELVREVLECNDGYGKITGNDKSLKMNIGEEEEGQESKVEEERESLRDPPRVSIPFGKEEPTDYHFIPTDWLRCWATGESPPGYKPSNPPANSKVIDVDTEASSSTEAKAAEDPAPANLPGTSKCNNLQLCCQEHALA
ncbi:hypothetical protein TrRE_jg8601, partial [Triparma retinervis]